MMEEHGSVDQPAIIFAIERIYNGLKPINVMREDFESGLQSSFSLTEDQLFQNIEDSHLEILIQGRFKRLMECYDYHASLNRVYPKEELFGDQ